MACGTGRMYSIIKEYFKDKDIEMFDRDAKMVKAAKKNLAKYGAQDVTVF